MSRKHPTRITRGINLIDCIQIVRQHGCEVEPIHRSGEIRFSHPLMPRPEKEDARRKDTSRAVTTWINKLLGLLRSTAA